MRGGTRTTFIRDVSRGPDGVSGWGWGVVLSGPSQPTRSSYCDPVEELGHQGSGPERVPQQRRTLGRVPVTETKGRDSRKEGREAKDNREFWK